MNEPTRDTIPILEALLMAIEEGKTCAHLDKGILIAFHSPYAATAYITHLEKTLAALGERASRPLPETPPKNPEEDPCQPNSIEDFSRRFTLLGDEGKKWGIATVWGLGEANPIHRTTAYRLHWTGGSHAASGVARQLARRIDWELDNLEEDETEEVNA